MSKPTHELEIKLLLQESNLVLARPADPDEWQEKAIPSEIESLFEKFPPTAFQSQRDIYYQHPCFDMRERDLVLRRRESLVYEKKKNKWQLKAEEDKLTYKGKARSSSGMKSREEMEFPVPEEIWTVLEKLDFPPALEVAKHRWISEAFSKERRLEISLDAVQSLGLYLEVEMLIAESDFNRGEELIQGFLIDNHLEKFPAISESYADLLTHKKI